MKSSSLLSARMASGSKLLCQGCDTIEYELVALCYKNNKESLDIFRSHGVLANMHKCPKCNKDLKVPKKNNMWRCSGSIRDPISKTSKRCGFKMSDLKGSFLEKK